jgi:hypothetical protein
MKVNDVSVSRLLKLVAFVLFLAAFAVTEAWLTHGTWPQWTTAGLAVFTLAEIV